MSDILEIMGSRHSVRKYQDKELAPSLVSELEGLIRHCNEQGDFHIQLVLEEPEALRNVLAYGCGFRNARNYLALVGRDAPDLQEQLGYYGEYLVLKATALGLGTCWVAGTYNKSKCRCAVAPEEKLVCVIALGYPAETGRPHATKTIAQLSQSLEPLPEWFLRGMEGAQLAPTAMNQQKFQILFADGQVSFIAGKGAFTRLDLGIVKCHFHLASRMVDDPFSTTA